MPLYRHTLTGNEDTLDPETVSAYAPGTWELVADESPAEAQVRIDAEVTHEFEQDKAVVEVPGPAPATDGAHAAPDAFPQEGDHA